MPKSQARELKPANAAAFPNAKSQSRKTRRSVPATELMGTDWIVPATPPVPKAPARSEVPPEKDKEMMFAAQYRPEQVEAAIAATSAKMEKLRRLQAIGREIDKVSERIAEDTARLESLKAEAVVLSAEIN